MVQWCLSMPLIPIRVKKIKRTLHDFRVGLQGLFQNRVAEGLSIGNLTHKELYYDEELVDGLIEPRGSSRWSRSSDGLL